MKFADRLARLGFDNYDAYLRSPGWRERRAGVLNAARGLCACGEPAVQVHHRTYARLGHERPSDLHAVCRLCHEKIHGYVAQGSALEAATMAVLEGADFPRPGKRTEKEKRRAKRKRRQARKRAARLELEAAVAARAEQRAAEFRKAGVRTATLDETARRIAAIGRSSTTETSRPAGAPGSHRRSSRSSTA